MSSSYHHDNSSHLFFHSLLTRQTRTHRNNFVKSKNVLHPATTLATVFNSTSTQSFNNRRLSNIGKSWKKYRLSSTYFSFHSNNRFEWWQSCVFICKMQNSSINLKCNNSKCKNETKMISCWLWSCYILLIFFFFWRNCAILAIFCQQIRLPKLSHFRSANRFVTNFDCVCRILSR